MEYPQSRSQEAEDLRREETCGVQREDGSVL